MQGAQVIKLALLLTVNSCTLLFVISADANLIICFPRLNESVLSVSLIIFDADFRSTTL